MNKPTLYLMYGYPGAGKTTAAETIHKLTGAIHLSSDRLRSEMFGKPTFSGDEHEELYSELDKRTKDLLKAGKSVIYDANLNRYKHRQDKYHICQKTGAKAVLLWIQTPRQLAKDRASHFSRQHLWPENETADQLFERIAELIEEPSDSEHYIAIDGTKITEEYLRTKLDISKAK